jgi:hypothetical protein
MKKVLLSTIVLTAFSLSIILFEISCKKTANADSPPYSLPVATTTKLGGVIPDGTTISVDANGKISTIGSGTQQASKLLYGVYGSTDLTNTVWLANYDGTNPQQLNITLPTGLAIDVDNLKISPDHQTIFFSAYTPSANSGGFYIYACNIDGSNPHQILSGGTNGSTVAQAY